MRVQEKTIMRANENVPARRPSVRVPGLTETMLLVMILAAFLLLHILAGMIVQRAGTGDDAPSQPDVRSQLYD
jgi:hypothetical protein